MQRLGSVALTACAAVVASTARADEPPNILLLLADDLGPANVGAYVAGPNGVPGNPPPTPNLDALAAGGVLFRAAWAAPVCSPSRANLLTGRYGFRTSVRCALTLDDGLPLEETILPELLSQAGYESALFGKWHLGCTVALGGVDAPRTAGWTHHAGAVNPTLEDYFCWQKAVNGEVSLCTNYATTETVDDALAWIQQRTGPWFCMMSFNAPHAPFHSPPEHLHTIDLTYPTLRRRYKAAIEAMDTEIGRLLCGLGADIDRTLIIFAGDNGTPTEVLECPYWSGKGSVYEGGVHVPLIVSGPGVQGAGREVLEPVAFVDLFATVLDAAQVVQGDPTPPPVDGLSLLDVLADPGAPHPRIHAYTELVQYGAQYGQFAVRTQRYKVVQRFGCNELYDLVTDPLETSNLLAPGSDLTLDEQGAYDDLLAELQRLRSAICTADLDADGAVGQADLGLLLANYGQTDSPAAGDIDRDGDVDQADLGVLLSEYARTCW